MSRVTPIDEWLKQRQPAGGDPPAAKPGMLADYDYAAGYNANRAAEKQAAEKKRQRELRRNEKAVAVTKAQADLPKPTSGAAGSDDWARVTNSAQALQELGRLGVGVVTDDRLQIVPNLANHIAVLRDHPRFAGRFWYDSFHQDIRTRWDCDVARPWVDSDRLRLAAVLQADHGLVKFTDDLLEKAVIAIAQSDVRDELTEWLRSLQWDGTARLDGWLSRAVGAPADEYHVAVGRNFLLSLVARALRPGCKADCMPVFEGAQGSNKSTMLAVLGGPYFAELTESLDTKDFFIVLQSKWLIEVAELDAFRRSDVTRIKQLLTSQKDRCRLPYTRRAVDMPRRVIFAGSTNETAYLQDATGARRFWPVKADAIDLGWLRANREQLFAEAVALFDGGASWWEVPVAAAKDQTDMRRNVDAWESRIADYCVGKAVIDVSSVLEALGVEVARQGKSEQMRAASALRLLGYHRVQKRVGTVPRWVWVKPGAVDDDETRPF